MWKFLIALVAAGIGIFGREPIAHALGVQARYVDYALGGVIALLVLSVVLPQLGRLFNGDEVDDDGPIEHEDGRPLGTRPRS